MLYVITSLRVFTTSHAKHPYKVDCEYNSHEFQKGNKLTKQTSSYTPLIIPELNRRKSEYMPRLYFRRRLFWQLQIIKAEPDSSGDDIPTPKGKNSKMNTPSKHLLLQ